MLAAAVAPAPPSLSRDDLEALLRARKLDRTLTTAPADEVVGTWCVPTGAVELDTQLHGGLPRGHLSEVIGPRSSGRLALVVSAMAQATARGEAVALIDPLDMFDPVSASATLRHAQGGPEPGRGASGIDFGRMLWIRGEPSGSARVSLSCEHGTLQKALDRAVKALNLVLQAGGFGLVVLDFGEVSPQAIARLPYTTWLRLQHVFEGSSTACVLIGSEPMARSSGGVSVLLDRPRAQSPKPEAPYISARVVRSRARENERHVCVPLSSAAC